LKHRHEAAVHGSDQESHGEEDEHDVSLVLREPKEQVEVGDDLIGEEEGGK